MRRLPLLAAAAAALFAGAASPGSATTNTTPGRTTLADGDSFVVMGSKVLCRVGRELHGLRHALACGLLDPRTGGTLRRSRRALISDARVVIRPAASEVAVSGDLFRARQPITLAGLPFAGPDGPRKRLVLRNGDTAAIGGTHIWCTDVEATLTCAKVWPPRAAAWAGTFAVAISPTSIGVAQARVGRMLVPLASWPLIGGH
jgi:hypothetical protein